MAENLWTRCNNCQRILYKQDILDNFSVCPACDFHFRLSAPERLFQLFDDGRFDIVDHQVKPVDSLHFVDSVSYARRIEDQQRKTSLPDAVVNGIGTLGGLKVVICAMDFSFMGGSMGSVVGEKIALAAERALADGIPFISVLADPTTGGTTASYAMLGDLNIAEPNALIGFAGPRVIEQTIKEKLPKGFQRSEFLLKHGMLDDVVPRKALRPTLIRALRLFLNHPQ
jgi:acetyl-CoA carboxylase carboxyl transferase subunit beta